MSQESERDDELPECTYCQNQLTEEEYEENPTCKRHLDWACRNCLFWCDSEGEWYCLECAKDAEQFLNDGSKQCVCEVCQTLVSQDDEQDYPEEDDELENDDEEDDELENDQEEDDELENDDEEEVCTEGMVYCEVGAHYVNPDDHWSSIEAFADCGDCFECTGFAKEICEIYDMVSGTCKTCDQ